MPDSGRLTPDRSKLADSGRTSRLSAYYDDYWSEEGCIPDQSLFTSFRQILEQNVRPDDECIDVGCGRGAGASAWLAEHTGSYVGVDVSQTAVDTARAAGLKVERIEDATKLPFPDETFSLAACLEVFEHLLEPHLAAREILRILRPGGRLLATVPNIAYWRRRADMAFLGRWNPVGDVESPERPWRDPHLRFFGRGNLEQMLREVGFEPTVIGGHGISWMKDVPGIRRLMRRQDPGPIYSHLVKAAPTVFALRFHAVATKPAAPASD